MHIIAESAVLIQNEFWAEPFKVDLSHNFIVVGLGIYMKNVDLANAMSVENRHQWLTANQFLGNVRVRLLR